MYLLQLLNRPLGNRRISSGNGASFSEGRGNIAGPEEKAELMSVQWAVIFLT